MEYSFFVRDLPDGVKLSSLPHGLGRKILGKEELISIVYGVVLLCGAEDKLLVSEIKKLDKDCSILGLFWWC